MRRRAQALGRRESVYAKLGQETGLPKVSAVLASALVFAYAGSAAAADPAAGFECSVLEGVAPLGITCSALGDPAE